jgi:NTP pyrophosphatase (non-canonical NTP hydrolase)
VKLSEAQTRVDAQVKSYGKYWDIKWMAHRLFEEIGELSRAINIKYGEKPAKSANEGKNLEEELADVFFTTIALTNRFGIELNNFNDNDIETIFSELRKNICGDIDYGMVLMPYAIKEGELASLIYDVETKKERILDEITISKITEVLEEMIMIVIDMAASFNIYLPSIFKEKVAADEDKLTMIYKK